MIQGAMQHINGMQVHFNPYLPLFEVVQFRFPKTKKKRIQKKWAKQTHNFRQVPVNNAYVVGNTIIIHPSNRHLLERLSV